MQRVRLSYTALGRSRYRVTGRYADGTRRRLGQVQRRWFRHIQQMGWEATGADGSHRAVHEFRWQAGWALAWDGTDYPFPVSRAHRQ